MTRRNRTGTSSSSFSRHLLLFSLCAMPATAHAWDWALDWIIGGIDSAQESSSSWLSLEQVSDLRVRDIKRRLARTHGYSADELAAMIFKKELVEALAFEEEKIRLKYVTSVQRDLLKKSVVVALVAVLLVMCWPLILQAYEVALVNFVVYTDRKKLEARKCWEFQTKWGLLGVSLMLVMDLLQAWLTVSVLLSWVLPSSSPRWFLFPTPHIPVRPAQFMGGPMSQAFGGYGINIGSMVVTWGMRFVHGRLESWTGLCLAAAIRRKKQKKSKPNGSNTNADQSSSANATQPISRRKAHRLARQAAASAAASNAAHSGMTMPPPPPDLPPSLWDKKGEQRSQEFPSSKENQDFMDQLNLVDQTEDAEEEEVSGLHELD